MSSTLLVLHFSFIVVVVVARLIWQASLLLLFMQEVKLSFVLPQPVWPPFYFLVVVQSIHTSKFPFLSMNRVPATLKKMISLIHFFSRPLLSSGIKQVLNTISFWNLLIILYMTCSTKITHLEESLSCLVETSDKLCLLFSMDQESKLY